MKYVWILAGFLCTAYGFEVDLDTLLKCEFHYLAMRTAMHRGNQSRMDLIYNCTAEHLQFHHEVEETLKSLRDRVASSVKPQLINRGKLDQTNLGSIFTCDVTTRESSELPTSVHQLRPSDIKVIAAMGDSLTAANGGGGETLLDVSKEYRGIAFSIGDDSNLDTITTLPNILQMYNPLLIGASQNVGPVWYKPVSKLNVAVPGSKAINLTSQAMELVKRLKQTPEINFNLDWKLITIFIGANDLCAYCRNRELYSTKSYVKHFTEALDLLKLLVPRALISIVNNVDVTKLRKLHVYPYCKLLRRFECPCILNDTDAAEVHAKAAEYQHAIHELINGGRYDTDDQFTAVVQQFIEGVEVPMIDVDGHASPDVSFFAPDCFHFGEKAHAAAARALWMDLLSPIGGKQTRLDISGQSVHLSCPNTSCPYIRTSKNSLNCSASKDPEKKQMRNGAILLADSGDSSRQATFSPALIAGIVLVSLSLIVASGLLGKYFINRRTTRLSETSPLLAKIS